MTLDSLHSRRNAYPYYISLFCTLPLLVHSGGLRPVLLTYRLAALGVGLTIAFFYVTLKLRKPSWDREQDEHVREKIKGSLMELIPNDLNVTEDERNQLERAEIYKSLTGVFWDTINQDDLLRAQKEQFYSNGLHYSTAIDVSLLLRVFAICYLVVAVLLGDFTLFLWGTGYVVVALLSKWVAVPHARRQHLALSDQQLDLLKKRKGDHVSGLFREIVNEWRKAQSPMSPESKQPSHSRYVFLWDSVTIFIVLLAGLLGIVMRGWLGPEARIRSNPEEASSYIGGGDHDKPTVVVFVHGVFGDSKASWLNTPSATDFPELLATDPLLSHNVDVFVFEYFTPKFSLAPSISDLADQLRGALDDHQVFARHKQVIFLAHSMGGIVVRQYLLGSQEKISAVPMIYFYATPTNGSELAALARIASTNPQLRGMTPIEGNDFLQSIQSNWLKSKLAQSIASYCGVEELPTDGEIVVTRSSATALCNRPLDPFSANHIDIVKPESRSDPRYTRFRTALVKEVPSLSAQARH